MVLFFFFFLSNDQLISSLKESSQYHKRKLIFKIFGREKPIKKFSYYILIYRTHCYYKKKSIGIGKNREVKI